MERTLPPITEPVSKKELWNIFLREVYSAKDLITEKEVREMLSSVGLDYDQEKAKCNSMTDEEIFATILA